MPMHKTSAWPLALIYAGLIVYASLFPFSNWRDQGVVPWFFLIAPLPRYWTVFDVVANLLGYMPLGFFLVLSALRTGRTRYALRMAVLAASALSLLMESLQVYLPNRVPSNLDLMLNVAGGALGALSAWSLEKLGVLQRWSRFRANWFVPDARGGLVLLALWPLALLFPTSIPFGLGQVFERLQARMAGVLADTPFLEWLPMRQTELHALWPAAEWLCVVLGLLIPCLLGFCIIGQVGKRAWFLLWMCFFAVWVSALSAALSVGPEHAWAWLSAPVKAALMSALVLAVLLLWVPRRASAALALLAVGVHLSLLNQAAVSPYFEHNLFLWEQGRFIRFHGLAQWLGWLWPFATLAYLLSLLWGRGAEN
jgi:VanZ family protein